MNLAQTHVRHRLQGSVAAILSLHFTCDLQDSAVHCRSEATQCRRTYLEIKCLYGEVRYFQPLCSKEELGTLLDSLQMQLHIALLFSLPCIFSLFAQSRSFNPIIDYHNHGLQSRDLPPPPPSSSKATIDIHTALLTRRATHQVNAYRIRFTLAVFDPHSLAHAARGFTDLWTQISHHTAPSSGDWLPISTPLGGFSTIIGNWVIRFYTPVHEALPWNIVYSFAQNVLRDARTYSVGIYDFFVDAVPPMPRIVVCVRLLEGERQFTDFGRCLVDVAKHR